MGMSLLAPKNSAHVTVLSRITTPHLIEFKNTIQNYEGEMVVLKAEKQARQQEIQLRQNQEADYLKTLEADKQRQAQKAEEEKISKEKEQAKQEKAAALVTAKDTAQQLLDEA